MENCPGRVYLLGKFELTGKQRSGAYTELIFESVFDGPISPMDVISFTRAGQTVIVIKDRTLAKRILADKTYNLLICSCDSE